MRTYTRKSFVSTSDHATRNPYSHANPELKTEAATPEQKDLKATVDAILLVDMAVPCLLRAVLKNNHHSQQKRYVKPHEPEQRGEDPIEKAVGEVAEGPHAIDFLRCHEGARADVVWREGVVEIATALELLLDQALGSWRLLLECCA